MTQEKYVYIITKILTIIIIFIEILNASIEIVGHFYS